MEKKKTADIKGYSNENISEALDDALSQVTSPAGYHIVETRGIQSEVEDSQYEVTLAPVLEVE